MLYAVFVGLKHRLLSLNQDLKSEHNRQIIKNLALIVFFIFIGKLLGAIKEIVIAWRYGLSETVDAYLFLFNIFNLPISIWLSVQITLLVPLINELKKCEPAELKPALAELGGLTVIVSFSIWIIVLIAVLVVFKYNLINVSEAMWRTCVPVVFHFSLVIPTGMMVGTLSALLLAYRRHSNTLLESVPALAILLTVSLWPARNVGPLVWSTVIGFAAQFALLIYVTYRAGLLVIPEFLFRSKIWNSVAKSYLFIGIGPILTGLVTLVDQVFVAGLGVGQIASLSCANRVVGLIIGIGGTALQRATMPIFSNYSTDKVDEVCQIALKWSKAMILVSVIPVVLVIIWSDFIIKIIFERGAFQESDTANVSDLFRLAVLQTPFYMGGLVLVSVLTSLKHYKAILLFSVIVLVVKVLLNLLLVNTFGATGLVFSTIVMVALSFLLKLKLVTTIKNRFLATSVGI